MSKEINRKERVEKEYQKIGEDLMRIRSSAIRKMEVTNLDQAERHAMLVLMANMRTDIAILYQSLRDLAEAIEQHEKAKLDPFTRLKEIFDNPKDQ